MYWDISVAPDVLGVAVGSFTDPTFPPPMISGFEAYGAAWAMNVSELRMPHHDYDGDHKAGHERDYDRLRVSEGSIHMICVMRSAAGTPMLCGPSRRPATDAEG